MAEDESLLDVFVKVLPHPDNDDVVKAAVEKTKAMFGTLASSAPVKMSVQIDDKQAEKAYQKFLDTTLKAEQNQRTRTREIYNAMLSDRERYNQEIERQNRERVESATRALADERRAAEAENRKIFSDLKNDIISRSEAGSQSQAGGLRREFVEAKRYAEDLSREVGQIFRKVREVDDVDLSAQFRRAVDDLKLARVELNRGAQDSDPFALKYTLSLLEEVRQKFLQIGSQAINQIDPQNQIRDRFRNIVESERQDRPNFNIDSGLRARFTQGLNFDEKKQLQEMIAEARRAEVAFESLKRTFDGSAESLENLSAQSIRLKELRQSVIGQLDAVDQQSRSFNTLSNNAYQLGQAFEDAAVGFSLNGFAGAVRGAANNVAFLLNDLSRLQSVQNALPAGWAKQLPLIAGIGSALAITVLPKVIEWLESLNDIELKFKNIANEIQASLEDRQLEISLRVENRELQRTLEEAESVEDVLKRIRDIDFEVGSKKQQLQEIFAGLRDIQLVGDEFSDRQKIEAQIDSLFNSVQQRIRERVEAIPSDLEQARNPISDLLPRLRDTAINLFPPGSISAETSETQLNLIRQFKADVFQLRRQILEALDLGESGDATVDTFVRAQREIQKFQEGLAANLERLDVADPEAKVEAFNQTLSQLNGELQKGEELTREIANAVNKQFTVAFDSARKKVAELQDQLQLNQNVVLGLNVDFDLDLLGINERINEGREILNGAIEAIRKASADSGIAVDEAGVASLQEEFRLRSLLTIDDLRKQKIEDIRDTEEDILAIREKQKQSAFTTLEAYSRELQKNVLSDASSSTDKRNRELQEELAKAREDFERLNASRQRVEQNLPFGDIAARRREELELGPRGRANEDVFGIERERIADDLDRAFERHTDRLIEAINQNTDATKEIDPSARAK